VKRKRKEVAHFVFDNWHLLFFVRLERGFESTLNISSASVMPIRYKVDLLLDVSPTLQPNHQFYSTVRPMITITITITSMPLR